MTESSARFGMPFIFPGQAQKEIYHNEALNLIDCVLHPCIEAGPIDEPPSAPMEGQAWVVGDAPVEEWSGSPHDLAFWSDGGWRFIGPVPGMLVWNKVRELWLHWTGTGWSDGEVKASRIVIGGQQIVGARLPEVASPSGGTTIDQEARASIAGLIATLKSHGLID